jgi:hypothetical protein
MGLENTGFAIANADELWIDRIDYWSELAHAVDLLVSARIKVSVYNLQRCVLDRSIGPMQHNRFLIGRMDTLKNATVASKKSDAAAFSLQAAHVKAVVLISPIPKFTHG